jgi:hypothetical protein
MVEKALPGETNPTQFRVLEAAQCQCLAAAHAPLASLLHAESQLALRRAANQGAKDGMAQSVLADLLELRALEDRNEKAALADELFYRLVEADYARALSQCSLQELDRALDNLEQLKSKGLLPIADDGRLRRQKLDLLDRRAALQSSIRRLDGQLCILLGIQVNLSAPLSPTADLGVVIAAIDPAAAISQGLAGRADLRAIATLENNLNMDTVSAVRSGLQRVDALLGGNPASGSILARLCARGEDSGEFQTRREQLRQLYDQQSRSAEEEIGAAVFDVETSLRQIGLAKDKLDSWKEELRRLQSKRQTDGVTEFDVSAAQLELFQAENALVHQIIQWKIVGTKLKKAQGMLAAECGYRLPPCN